MEVNKSHIISGLIGFVMGGSTCLGGISLLTHPTESENDGGSDLQTRLLGTTKSSVQPKKKSRYELTSYSPSGDAIITPSGKKFHVSSDCPALSNSTETKTVMTADAERNGYEACHKCFNP